MTRREPSFVAVFLGTVRHPFRRLVGWIAELSLLGEYRFHVQHGLTPPPPGLAGTPMPGITATSNLMRRADSVITLAGPGLIMDARNAGHLPVVAARDPLLGEHVDDHQQRFVRYLAPSGAPLPGGDARQLASALAAAVAPTRPRRCRRPAAAAGGDTAAFRRFEALVEGLVKR